MAKDKKERTDVTPRERLEDERLINELRKLNKAENERAKK